MAAAHSPDTASRKRARTESVTDVTQDIQIEDVDEVPQVKHEGITRNEEIWFEDGSVVLVAADVGFRVHAGILSLHSTVFSELLHGPEMMLEQLDGCPVLRVSDTTADLGVFLTFLYAGIEFVVSSFSVDDLFTPI
ncbi:hypothetical protein B0H21DRAFT_698433 [Amylocystis lapponica]|nr:hypothetical protein B0H21DRAFT_698433 [Amylocystis lapponica]